LKIQGGKMDYTNMLFDVTEDDEKISDLLDKAYENFLDSNDSINPENIKIKVYKTVDELDDVNYMETAGYKAKEATCYKKSKIAIFIFVKEES
jgi:hypothetical protein